MKITKQILQTVAICGFLGTSAFSQALDVSPLPNSNLEGTRYLVFNYNSSDAHGQAANVFEGYWQSFVTDYNIEVTLTDNTGDLNENNLANHDVIVFNYFSGGNFNGTQRALLQNWVENGGHTMGFHTAALPREGQYDWYRENIIMGLYDPDYHGFDVGANGIAKKNMDLADDPILAGMPDELQTSDEWYIFNIGPLWDKMKFMYYEDESSMKPHTHTVLDQEVLDLPIAIRHPIAWYYEDEITGSRRFYTGLIHNWEVAETDFMKLMLMRSAEFTSGIDADRPGCPDSTYAEYDADRTSDDATMCVTLGINDQASHKGDYLKYSQSQKSITIKVTHTGNYQAILSHVSGRQISRDRFFNRKKLSLSTESLSRGMYILQIRRDGRNVGQRIFVVD